MKLVRWQPSSSWAQLHDEFDRMVERAFGGSFFAPTAQDGSGAALLSVPVNVIDRGDSIEVKAEIPGMDSNDVKITCEKGVLLLTGEKRHEEKSEKDNVYRYECRYGSFHRAIDLPCDVNADKAEATFANGVLIVRLPKNEAAKPKEVKIKVK